MIHISLHNVFVIPLQNIIFTNKRKTQKLNLYRFWISWHSPIDLMGKWELWDHRSQTSLEAWKKWHYVEVQWHHQVCELMVLMVLNLVRVPRCSPFLNCWPVRKMTLAAFSFVHSVFLNNICFISSLLLDPWEWGLDACQTPPKAYYLMQARITRNLIQTKFKFRGVRVKSGFDSKYYSNANHITIRFDSNKPNKIYVYSFVFYLYIYIGFQFFLGWKNMSQFFTLLILRLTNNLNMNPFGSYCLSFMFLDILTYFCYVVDVDFATSLRLKPCKSRYQLK